VSVSNHPVTLTAVKAGKEPSADSTTFPDEGCLPCGIARFGKVGKDYM
jgi:hypothetical protein